MSKKTIFPLFSPADAERVRPLLDSLKEKGFRIAGEKERKAPVLLVLSAAFAADEAAQEAFFAADGAGRDIIPLDLDGARQSDLVRSALMAKNAITAQGRTDEEIAARVASAGAFMEPPVWRPMWRIVLAAALLLALGAGLWLWRSRAPKDGMPPPPEPSETVQTESERFGLREKDLGEIVSVTIAGDRFYYTTVEDYRRTHRWPEWTDYAYGSWDGEAGAPRYYLLEDGREIALTRYDDLGLLALMPKLTYLTLIGVDSDALPSLADRTLTRVELYGCRLGGCEWLAGAKLSEFRAAASEIPDYSPLSACKKLEIVSVDLSGTSGGDFSRFSPAELDDLALYGEPGQAIDLSGMRACSELRTVNLNNLSVADLDFLSDAGFLWGLRINGLNELKDISALENKKQLCRLSFDNCGALQDISPLAGADNLSELFIIGCDALRDVSPLGDMKALIDLRLEAHSVRDFTPIGRCRTLRTLALSSRALQDVSFLSELTLLREVHLFFDTIPNVDFLSSLRPDIELSLSLNGDVEDYSGLAAPRRYAYLAIVPHGAGTGRALAYLRDTEVLRELNLSGITGQELALIPQPSETLRLSNADLRDLRGLGAWETKELTIMLDDLQNLRSLDGIEALRSLGSGMISLEIENCPRLGDLSALAGASLKSLSISRAVIVPELPALRLGSLRLESIAELEDLGCLDGLDASGPCDFALVGLDRLTDLTPLRRFHGNSLTVPPQLAEQAEGLAEEGCFKTVEFAYPEGGWQMDELDVTLESLDELETMPRALLRHVRRLIVAGDRVIGPNEDVWSFERWDQKGRAIPMLHDERSGEETEMGQGVLTDLSRLSELTGLEELVLWNQPIESLEGVQSFSKLRHLELKWCPKLTDVSPAFTLQELDSLSLRGTPVASIQGVQNLTRLRSLDISNTAVSDLSPLSLCRFEELNLNLEGIPIEDYSPLGSIGRIPALSIEGADSARWADALDGVEIGRLQFFNSAFDSESFARFMRAHPEIKVLWIPWNESIDDLTVLLELSELETVDISFSMKRAVKSLEGRDLPFELIVER